MNEYTAQDFKKGQPRWCPGCGDHFFLASLHKAMAELGVPPYETAVISGIGCSSRLPYYVNAYAMQTIHGRAAAISTGVKVTNPNLTVWQISGDGDGLVGTPDALGTGAEGAAVGHVVGRDEVVHATYLIHVMALADGIALRDDGALRLFDRTAHVRLQLRTFHFAVAVDGIHLAVVVEQHAEVVDVTLHVMVLPWPTDILGGVALQAFAIDISKDIELTVGIADGRCPDALTVDLLMILQREGIVSEVETVEAIGDILPVHEILRVKDHETWYGVHRGAGEIVIIADTQDVRVGKLVVEERVGKRAIAVISCPRLCLR